MKITIITLFPEMFEGIFSTSMLSRAQKSGKITYNIVHLREFGEGKHKVVDDKPYGGGKGMILKVDVLYKAIQSARIPNKKERVIILDARGQTYTQELAQQFSKLDHLILICGRYEGFDERIKQFVDYSISIGEYILTGGEIPSMVISDSVTRLVEGAILENCVTESESFSGIFKDKVEFPQYTRPEIFKDLAVPKILLSGDHKKIEQYKQKESDRLSQKRKTSHDLS